MDIFLLIEYGGLAHNGGRGGKLGLKTGDGMKACRCELNLTAVVFLATSKLAIVSS